MLIKTGYIVDILGEGGGLFSTFCPRGQGGGYVKYPRLSTQGGGGVKNGQNLVHVVVEYPLKV